MTDSALRALRRAAEQDDTPGAWRTLARALERAGFVLEGVLHGAQVRRDGRHDLQMWSHVRTQA